MATKNILIFAFFLISPIAFCQSEKIIHGKIIVKDANAQGVHIINLVNEEETISNTNGEFNIVAKTDDLLVFSSNHLDYQRKIIEEDDYQSGQIKIEMTPKVKQLDEVVIIKYPEFDAVKLGILSKPPKKYTPAERHLHTARSGPVDFIANSLSGRTKMLKKAVVYERKNSLLSILDEMYNTEYYIKELHIDASHINGFKYYAIEDKNLASALRLRNKALISFILVKLSVDYNILQPREN